MKKKLTEEQKNKVREFIKEKKENSKPPRAIKGKNWITGEPTEWSINSIEKAAAATGEKALEVARKHDPKDGYIVYQRAGKKVREYVDGRIVPFDDFERERNNND